MTDGGVSMMEESQAYRMEDAGWFWRMDRLCKGGQKLVEALITPASLAFLHAMHDACEI